ncbi:MAG: RluA family pseudouridine synthase [Verrucomicrobia bacterium]|nr:RluA family pseudouridine synthase [Verrucomicrobiota bacterium]MDA1066621.1 RluA family pseudouridine synthase [Verrucomicrobiota bacterium]
MIQTIEVESGTGKIRADKWISGKMPDLSRMLIQKAFEEGLVKLNNQVISKSAKLKGGDVVSFQLPDIKPLDLTPQDIPLTIIYEDEHMLALDKPSGMIVHPGAGTGQDTLVHALLHHCRGGLSGIGGVERPGIVHRLDRETSGIMVVAKSDLAHRGLTYAFANRKLSKEYLALVLGVPDRLSGSIELPIGRNQNHRHKMTIREDGKPAHTDWEFLGEAPGPISLLRCQLHSGRTHQIRVHLSELGFPILADEIYGYRPSRAELQILPERTMLHAYRLKLNHPITKKALELIAVPPADFQQQFPGWEQSLAKVNREKF